MILQALVKRYEQTGGGLFGWQNRFADYAVNIDVNGNVLDIISLEQKDGKKRIRKAFELPEEPSGRTSGIKAWQFLCDNGGYFFGNDAKRGDKKFENSAILHNDILTSVKTPTAEAILAFFKEAKPPDGLPETGNFIFMVNGRCAHEDAEIRKAWNDHKEATMVGETIRCLVSGEEDPSDGFTWKNKTVWCVYGRCTVS